jgi:hypothetical protein
LIERSGKQSIMISDSRRRFAKLNQKLKGA